MFGYKSSAVFWVLCGRNRWVGRTSAVTRRKHVLFWSLRPLAPFTLVRAGICARTIHASPLPPKMPEPATWRSTRSEDYFTGAGSSSSLVMYLRRVFVPPSLELHPLDLLTRMSPLAFVQCVMYAQMSGELERLARFGVVVDPLHGPSRIPTFHSNSTSTLGCIHEHAHPIIGGIPLAQAVILLVNGCIAFGLNVVSFSANGKVGALSMTVAGKSH